MNHLPITFGINRQAGSIRSKNLVSWFYFLSTMLFLRSHLPPNFTRLYPVLHLDVDNLANDQGSQHLRYERPHSHLDAQRMCPQPGDVVWFDVEHEQEQGKGQGNEDDTAEAAFTRQRLYL